MQASAMVGWVVIACSSAPVENLREVVLVEGAFAVVWGGWV